MYTINISSQNFNEIMPCIYARFMEKEAREWRQIYKVSCLQSIKLPDKFMPTGPPIT